MNTVLRLQMLIWKEIHMVDQTDLQALLLSLLEPKVSKTTAQLVEEFRIEYQRQWLELEREGELLFGAGCGAIQQPATRIIQALFDLDEDKRLCCRKEGEYWWSSFPKTFKGRNEPPLK